MKLITFDQITLNSDGKYYYNFIQNKMEDITIIVSINTQGYTYTEYYNDQYKSKIAVWFRNKTGDSKWVRPIHKNSITIKEKAASD